MSLLEQAGLRLLHCLDPETAHGLALEGLKLGHGVWDLIFIKE